MPLPRQVSLGVGLATAALVWGVYNTALPSVAEARVSAPNDADLAATERAASWTAAAVVAGVSLLSKDPTVFVIGGSMVVALAWWHRHSNHFNAAQGKLQPNPAPRAQTNGMTESSGYMPAVA